MDIYLLKLRRENNSLRIFLKTRKLAVLFVVVMKNKHTPTPWTLPKFSTSDKWIEIPEAGIRIDYDDVDHDTQKANTEFVLRAVNSHDELLAALKLMVEVGSEYYDMDMGDNGAPALDQARAAIANAEKA